MWAKPGPVSPGMNYTLDHSCSTPFGKHHLCQLQLGSRCLSFSSVWIQLTQIKHINNWGHVSGLVLGRESNWNAYLRKGWSTSWRLCPSEAIILPSSSPPFLLSSIVVAIMAFIYWAPSVPRITHASSPSVSAPRDRLYYLYLPASETEAQRDNDGC